ncbi:MAG: TetR/AcrR family transcriptional regulator [Cyanobacteria bacterium P01_D01_bin.44]
MTTPENPSLRDALAYKIADVFRTNGYEGTSMAQIAKATGLLKGSLYHHFPKGKEDMARAAMQILAQEAERLMIAALTEEGSPRQKLEAWAKGVEEFYLGGEKNCLLGIMVLSGGADRFQSELKDAFSAWISVVSGVLIEAGASEQQARKQAQAAIERIQGALIVARALEDFSGFQQLVQDLPNILLDEIDA